MTYTAGNWSVADDNFSKMFLLQNLKQFWLPEEIALANDILSWEALSQPEKDTYMKVLGGLTLLDTIQGDLGMPSVMASVESHQQKAVLAFMGAMENAVHARSYSNIFMTLATQDEIKGTFDWVSTNEQTQKKAHIIGSWYQRAEFGHSYMAKVASVALESFLFYSGFFYPLFLSGQGKLRRAGEVITLIIRDEAIHGAYVGLLAQLEAKEWTETKREEVERDVYELFDTLLENEIEYTRELYDTIGLTHEVIDFLKYNANKALMNLGYPARYEHGEVNRVVLNGLDSGNQAHDFFSVKSDKYTKPTVEATQDDDFKPENFVV